MTPTGDQTGDRGLIQRVEVLLASLTAVASARVILHEEEGAQVHIIATSELPVSEVSRAVTSALTWGLGFDVPSSQITVVQSRLSRMDLQALLGTETADPPSTPVVPESPPTDWPDPERSVPSTGLPVVPENPPIDWPDPERSARSTGLLEFSLGGADGETKSGSELDPRRLELQDLQLNKNPQGGFGILVRLAYNDRSVGARREAPGTEEDFLEVPASAALDVIEEFLRAGREDEPNVVLRFLAARRLRHPQHDTVVVLVEAEVRGRRIPLTGAASARYNGVERASVLATLQATNAFVAGTLIADSARRARAQLPPSRP